MKTEIINFLQQSVEALRTELDNANKTIDEQKEIISELNDKDTAICTTTERSFLNALSGGCSAPVGAYVTISKNTLFFNGIVLSTDGKEKIEISLEDKVENAKKLGQKAADIALSKGALKLIESAKDEKYS